MIKTRKNDAPLNDECFGEIFQLSENKKQKKETERPGEENPIKKRRKKNEEKGRKSEENEKGGKKSKGEKKNYDRGEGKGAPQLCDAGWEEKSQKAAEGAGEERREKEKKIIDHSQQSAIACQYEASECVRDLSRTIMKCTDILSLLNVQLNILNVELETTRKENGEKEKKERKEREIASREYDQKSRENRASESASETEEEEEYESNRGMEEAMYWGNSQQWQRDNF